MAFVPQRDHFSSSLTVKECLIYASKFQKNSQNMSEDDCIHEARALHVVGLLGLANCSDTRVDNCSGGELKRLGIGQELMGDCKLLILDEPTTGLDSSSCVSLIKLLRTIAVDQGMAVLITIHQPSLKIFHLFDHVYALSKFGKCIFEGPPTSLNQYLHKHKLEISTLETPFDHLMDIASCPSKAAKQEYSNHKKEVTSGELMINRLKTMIAEPKNSSSRQFWIHLDRSAKSLFRDKYLWAVRLGLHVAMAIVMSMLYSGTNIGTAAACAGEVSIDVNLGSLKRIQSHVDNEFVSMKNNVLNWLYALIFLSFLSTASAVLTFPLELEIVRKEHFNGWYSIKSYFLAKSIVDLPVQVASPVVYILTMYVATGHPLDSYLRLSLVIVFCVLLTIASQSLGMLAGAVAKGNVTGALYLSVAFLAPMVLFSGAFIFVQDVPMLFKPFCSLSVLRYALEGVLATIYGYDRCGSDNQEQLDRTINSVLSLVRSVFKIAFVNEDTKDQLEHAGVYSSNVSVFANGFVSRALTKYGANIDDGNNRLGILSTFQINESVVPINMICLIIVIIVTRYATYRFINYNVSLMKV